MTIVKSAVSILVLSLAMVASAGAQTFKQIEAAAKAEGKLVVYTSIQDAEMQVRVPAFEAAYPEIRVQYIRLPSSQIFSRFVGEKDAGVVKADFLATGSTALYQLRPELFVPLSSEKTPNLTSNIAVKAANPNYLVFQVDTHVVTYNSSLVSDKDLATHLSTWEGLADPRWAGKIALVDPHTSTNQVSFMLMLREKYGDEWYKRFVANRFELVTTATAGAQKVAAGAYHIVVPTIPAQSQAVRAQGAPVKLYQPGGIAHSPAQGMAVPLNSPNPNAALVFLNWMLSPKGQQLTCDFGSAAVLPVASGDCAVKLPKEFMLGRDVIDKADQDKVFSLVGGKP